MGKTVLITGAAGGIATELAKRALAKGYSLSLVDVDGKGLEAVVKLLAGAGRTQDSIFCTVADVSKEEDVSRYVKATIDRFGSIDCFANNAGIEGKTVSIADMTVEEFDRVYAINVRGVFLGLRAVIPQMRKQGYGSIVNVGSLASLMGFANMGAYTMSKHAVAGLTKSAALETAAFGIRVNAVLPGVVNTLMMRRIENDFGDATATRVAFENSAAMKRYAEPDEVAAVIEFLLSDDASYITSSLYTVDGGTTWM